MTQTVEISMASALAIAGTALMTVNISDLWRDAAKLNTNARDASVILDQYPMLISIREETITRDNWREVLAQYEAKYGKTLLFEVAGDES